MRQMEAEVYVVEDSKPNEGDHPGSFKDKGNVEKWLKVIHNKYVYRVKD